MLARGWRGRSGWERSLQNTNAGIRRSYIGSMDNIITLIEGALAAAPFGQRLDSTQNTLTIEPAGVAILPGIVQVKDGPRAGYIVTEGRFRADRNTVYGCATARAAVRKAMQSVRVHHFRLERAPDSPEWHQPGDTDALAVVAKQATLRTGMRQAIALLPDGVRFEPSGTTVIYAPYWTEEEDKRVRGLVVLRERLAPDGPFDNTAVIHLCRFREDAVHAALGHVLDTVLDSVFSGLGIVGEDFGTEIS